MLQYRSRTAAATLVSVSEGGVDCGGGIWGFDRCPLRDFGDDTVHKQEPFRACIEKHGESNRGGGV